jgi:type IV secretion system protein VirB3
MVDAVPGLTTDPLFVGATRPPMRWGVTYSALLFNLVLTLLVCGPIHGVCLLLCARDERFFDLVLLWARTRLPALFANYGFWQASAYSPLSLDLPDDRGRRGEDAIRAELPCRKLR